MSSNGKKALRVRFQRYLLTGLLVALPIWVTWLVFRFLLGLVASAGRPLVNAFAGALSAWAPTASRWLLTPWLQTLAAILLVLAVLYLLGWAATRVLGRKVLALMDSVVERIPVVQHIYGATRKLLAALQQKPGQVQRVVLIDFPTPEMKAVGLVTRTFTDESSGEELAAVYVPTTPNPTSGYLEIVPVARIVSTNWTLDEAMSFIISGGAVGPATLNFRR